MPCSHYVILMVKCAKNIKFSLYKRNSLRIGIFSNTSSLCCQTFIVIVSFFFNKYVQMDFKDFIMMRKDWSETSVSYMKN